jgi:hypothetical protein
MNNKNDPSKESTAITEAKTATAKPLAQPPADLSADTTPVANEKAGSAELSAEVLEFLEELKETVRALNVRRLNAKTLRRSLSNVRDILDDIDNYYAKD